MKRKNGFVSDITIISIKAAYEYQLKNCEWTFYNERELLENVLSNRFNSLLVVYSLFIMAFIQIAGTINKIVILGIGLMITSLTGLTIYRTYIKLDIIQKFIYSLGENDVSTFVKKEVKALKKKALCKITPIIGIIIPCLFVISFIAAIILISTNLWNVG